MTQVLVLRFRDLVTEPGGTIREHRRILDAAGHVWWGWWMRQYEMPPSELFSELYQAIRKGTAPKAYLLDSGQALLYACHIDDIRVAPPDDTIGPPQLDTTPAYYQRGAYPAWFRLTSITAEGSPEVPDGMRFDAFPTNPDRPENGALVGTEVESLDQVRNSDATLWVMSM